MNHETVVNNTQQTPTKLKHDVAAAAAAGGGGGGGASRTDQDQKHALAVAVATAEAAMATAQAAVEAARLTKPATHAREHYAAVVIQTAFRGYLVSTPPTDPRGMFGFQFKRTIWIYVCLTFKFNRTFTILQLKPNMH